MRGLHNISLQTSLLKVPSYQSEAFHTLSWVSEVAVLPNMEAAVCQFKPLLGLVARTVQLKNLMQWLNNATALAKSKHWKYIHNKAVPTLKMLSDNTE